MFDLIDDGYKIDSDITSNKMILVRRDWYPVLAIATDEDGYYKLYILSWKHDDDVKVTNVDIL